MTPTPKNPAGDASGDNPMIDLVPGQPPVPITVWRTPAGDDPAPISERLAYRLLAGYTEPGDTIVDLTGSTTLVETAAAGRRVHVPAQFTDSRTIIVPTNPPPADRRRARSRRGGHKPLEITDWFGDDLRDPDRPAGTIDDAPIPPANPTTAPSLLVAVWPLHHDEPANSDRLTDLMTAAIAVLRPGGTMAFVAATGSGGEYGALVSAARAAGLTYFQHIVAVRADAVAERFVYYATENDLAELDDGIGHTTVHTDIVVFAAPRHGAHRG